MFSEQLKQLRTTRGLTQKALAAQLRVSQQTVAKWESGSASPNPDTVRQIAAALDVSTDSLLGAPDTGNDTDNELDSLLQALRERPEIQMLFHATQGATPDDIRKAARFLDVLSEGGEGEG